MKNKLKAPFPWFGGKSRVSHLVWKRFGNVRNYIEPFFGSGAVLLGRPHLPQIETINDKDCFVSNFWRALQKAPEKVAKWCDWPVNEADLHARHRWLVNQFDFIERMKTDPDYYDVKVAGWWVWGISCWIGSGWCAGNRISGEGFRLSGSQGVHRKRPHLASEHGTRRQGVASDLQKLADRLRKVRVCCGDWKRICGEGPNKHLGTTAIFLDPPYSLEADRAEVYSTEDLIVAKEVYEWCLENGDKEQYRIALCGYEGEHKMPDTWESVSWKTVGGYGNQGEGRGKKNKDRERIWFSPHCLKVYQRASFFKS